jgi:pimeloyl-ACP methyl ester carboxylesterase
MSGPLSVNGFTLSATTAAVTGALLPLAPEAILVGSSHGGELSIDFTLQYPGLVRQLILVGAVVSGFPYTDHFLNRGMHNSQPFEKGDVTGGLSNWAKDKYLLAPGLDAAKKRLLDLLTTNPQDMTHSDYARPTQPALPRLKQIRVPTLILVGDADIPDVHAHAGAIEAGIPGSKRVIIPETGHLMYLEQPEEFSRAVVTFIDANSLVGIILRNVLSRVTVNTSATSQRRSSSALVTAPLC